MASRKRISPAERRHLDYLRRKGLQVASVYETRLAKERRKELRRVLDLARDYQDPVKIVPLLEGQLDETGYLPGWWTGLYTAAGLPHARTTAKELRQEKAAEEESLWLGTLRRYAQTRAANEIRIVTGTWKDSLVKIVRGILEEDLGLGIEKVTKEIYQRYLATIEKWQCRRIAQTEAMIGMAEAGDAAAKTLGIHYTKQWVISGLGNTRASHELMDGVTVDEDEPFVLPGGMMMFPHDTSMNPDPGEIINCACDVLRNPKGYGFDSPYRPAPKPMQAYNEQRLQKLTSQQDHSIPEETRRAIAENIMMLENEYGTRVGKRMTIAKADEQSANRHYKPEDDPTNTNCATCATTFILRRRGFKLTAKGRTKGNTPDKLAHNHTLPGYGVWKNADGTDITPSGITAWMKSKKYTSMTSERYEEFFKEVCKEKGDYILTLTWQKGGRHATILTTNRNGIISHVEPQVYEKLKGAKRSLKSLCDRLADNPFDEDNVFRADDKIFASGWKRLFDK